jgi:hypothetical protein
MARSARSSSPSLSRSATSHAAASAAKTSSTRVDVSRANKSSSASSASFAARHPLRARLRVLRIWVNGEGVTVNVTEDKEDTVSRCRKTRRWGGNEERGTFSDSFFDSSGEVSRTSRFSARRAFGAARPTTLPRDVGVFSPVFLFSSGRPPRRSSFQSPTSFMRRASHISSPRGRGLGTETRTARRREMCFEKVGGAEASRRKRGAKVFFLSFSFSFSFSSRSRGGRVRRARHVAGARRARVARPTSFRDSRGDGQDTSLRERVAAFVSDRRARARASVVSPVEFRGLDRDRNALLTSVSLNEPRGDARDARGEALRSRWRRARTASNTPLRLMRAWVSSASSRLAVAGRADRSTRVARDAPNTGWAEKGGACGFARVASRSPRAPSVDGRRDARRTTCTVTGVRAIFRLHCRPRVRFRCDESSVLDAFFGRARRFVSRHPRNQKTRTCRFGHSRPRHFHSRAFGAPVSEVPHACRTARAARGASRAPLDAWVRRPSRVREPRLDSVGNIISAPVLGASRDESVRHRCASPPHPGAARRAREEQVRGRRVNVSRKYPEVSVDDPELACEATPLAASVRSSFYPLARANRRDDTPPRSLLCLRTTLNFASISTKAQADGAGRRREPPGARRARARARSRHGRRAGSRRQGGKERRESPSR